MAAASPSRRLAAAGLAVCALALGAGAARAQARFSGRWVIAAAITAPWASDPGDAADVAEARRLVGRTVSFSPARLVAPSPLGCARPSYVIRKAAADTLFEGGLNADGAGRPTDPARVARTLGMAGDSVEGLTASCSEVEFFLIGPNTALFGLNNRVYRMTRSR